MTSFTTRMTVGAVGAITRSDSLTVQAEMPDQTTPPTLVGQFVKLVSGFLKPLASGDAAAVITGLTVRNFQNQSSTNTYGNTSPYTREPIDVLKRGYINVLLARGTSAKDGIVYVRTTAVTGKAVGDIETGADSGNCVATLGKFMGPADSTGTVEIAYNI